jgi:hypothetical protein
LLSALISLSKEFFLKQQQAVEASLPVARTNTHVLSFDQLPAKYARKQLSVAEMECIMVSLCGDV